ncbi:MAG: winged helix-turn-helix domain-containing protein [Spongiibacteraceae bacterium]
MSVTERPGSIDLAREKDFSLGPVHVRPSSRTVSARDKTETLEPRVMQVLVALARLPGEVVSRDQLIKECWAGRIVGDEVISRCIIKVRRLSETHGGFTLETIPRVGYRLVVTQPVPPPNNTATLGDEPRVRRTKSLLYLLGASLALFAVYFGVSHWRITSTQLQPEPNIEAHSTSKLRLAVLPFENLSPDPVNAFFTDGLHEEILTTLANRAPDLQVISRTTMLTYRGNSKSVTDLAEELGVTHVLDGSVRREGQDVRLTLRLIDARNDNHVWAHNYDRKLVNAMTLQSEVAQEVAAQMAVTLAAHFPGLPASSNPEAFDVYLRARLSSQLITAGVPVQEFERVESLFSRAIELDPRFAAAYLERNVVRTAKFIGSYEVSESTLQAMRRDFETVRQLVGDQPQLLALESQFALFVDWDRDKALRLIEMPQVVTSKDSAVLELRAVVLANSGRIEEALALYSQVSELDPGNPRVFRGRHFFLWTARRGVEALRVVDGFNERWPGALNRTHVLFAFTGKADEVVPRSDSIDQSSRLTRQFNLLRRQKRYKEAIELIERSPLTRVRHNQTSALPIPGIGSQPVAELRGWAEMLSGDRKAAARDGRAVLEFVQKEPVTKWNGWYLRFLEAEGQLFEGRNAEAIANARSALSMVPPNIKSSRETYARATAAAILAWAGMGDEAVELLEGLSKGYPGVGPAEITREPLYSVPLAKNARYMALEKKLEAEIAANQKLF